MESPEKVPYNIKHRAYYFSKEIVLFIKTYKYEKIFHSMFDQLLRSSTSIGANLIEGIAGSSKNDFVKFNIIALKSANETKYWLSLIKDTLDVDQELFRKYLKEVDEISKIIATIVIKSRK